MASSDSRDEDDRKKKPLSVRDVVGGRKKPPQAGSRSGSGRGGRHAEPGDGSGSDSAEVATAGPDAGAAGAAKPVGASDADARDGVVRSFVDDGTEWTLRVVGAGRSGTAPDRGVPLMHLHFATDPDPDAEPLRELLCPGRDIGDLYDEELRALLERSRPLSKKSSGRS